MSWSLLSPYRLVTCGEDGFARMWDVRGAVEKRFGNYQTLSKENDMDSGRQALQQNLVQQLPVQQNNGEIYENASGISANILGFGLQTTFGEFAFNDHIDDGVTLIASLQHASNALENESTVRLTRTGPGKPVKVWCIARCPLGGHFATGSEDGVARVWNDDEDWLVERHDIEIDPDTDLTGQYSKQSRMAPRG